MKTEQKKQLKEAAYKIADTIIETRTPTIAPYWSYDGALALLGIGALYDECGDKKYFDYIKTYAESMIDKDGNVPLYRMKEYNVDYVNPGNLCFWLYDHTKDDRYLKVIKMLKAQLDFQPRTASGIFFHKLVYPNQVWLDGLYMAQPFRAQYSSKFSDGNDFADIIDQIVKSEKALYDPRTGLYAHACDESKQIFWADKITGRSLNIWGRACGWLGMAIVDVLDFVPDDYPGCEKLIAILNKYFTNVLKYQDESGVWYQVLDSRHYKNYKEATCTCMFAYALHKGIKNGYLASKDYDKALEKALSGIMNEFIQEKDGKMFLTSCCEVAGMAGYGENRTDHDGSLEYYFSEPIVCNDFKGVGPLLKMAVAL